MLAAALRDLQWRRRRFLIAVVGTSLVFAMTLVLTGLSNGFTVEAEETVEDFQVDTWVVRAGAPGPFLGAAPIPADAVEEVAAAPGVETAGGFVYGRRSIGEGASLEDVNVYGAAAGGPAMPDPTEGRRPESPGEALVSTALGPDVGETFELAGTEVTVVGRVADSTSVAGVPNAFLLLEDARNVVFSGAPIVSAVATHGTPAEVPDGLVALDATAALDDLLRPLEQPRSSISFVAVLLWLVAGLIIGSVVYLSALERVRDFAVFKAVGVSTRAILGGLAAQAAILALAASLVGILVGVLLAPVFPMRVDIPSRAFVLLPALAVGVGVVASTVGMRRVTTVDPALAFGGP